MKSDLPLPVEVNEATGEWSVDGIPMILVPRHFLVNNHDAVEEALGYEASVDLYRAPGARSAHEWCEREAETHGLHGVEVFHHYMTRLSQRGWARFVVEELDPERGHARVSVENSVFVAERKGQAIRPVCYMFEGWIEGALAFVAARDAKEIRCSEVRCAALGDGGCLLEANLIPGP